MLEILDLQIEARAGNRRTRILNGISVTLNRGEVLGLVGESGAGKSTLGLAALGYLRNGCRLESGKVMFCGQDVMALPESVRRTFRSTQIAYVAQSASASFNPAIRLIDQIIEAAVNRGGQTQATARANALALFKAFQLPDPERFGDRYPHQVSGGQLQRAMVAMAMICKPSLIVFDEPTTALDVTTQVEVLTVIRKVIEESHVAALYITHDLAIVAQMAHRIAVLQHGNLVEEGSTQAILENPTHPYTQSLWAVKKFPLASSGTTNELLEVRSVSAKYGDLQVLDNVNLKVRSGQTVAIVGESGSGKSTLGRVIAGLKASAGSILFHGEVCPPRVGLRSKDLLRKIQIIYQSTENALNPRHTVKKILGRPLEFYHGLSGKDRDLRISQLLEMIELNDSYANRVPTQLSGGQRQRVAIARALAADPELIICDEITSALDQVVQAEILKMLISIQSKFGVSLLFVTHDIAVVRAIANEVVVLNKGKIVEHGKTDQVLLKPTDPYTKLLLASVPEMEMGWLERMILQKRESLAAEGRSTAAH